jgi:hypothetical protein
LDLTKSILKDVRETVGSGAESPDFDTELLMHINAAVGKLNQAGVANFIVVRDETDTWGDLQDPLQIVGNKYFHMIPLYISLSTKLIFDPPPPSAVEYQTKQVEELLWRLKIAYESTELTT